MSELLENAIHVLSLGVVPVGILVFLVTVITQVIKEIGSLAEVPTSIVVTTLSVVLTVIAMFAYVAYTSIELTWYLVVASVVGGFMVSYISMFGWETLTDLWNRSKK